MTITPANGDARTARDAATHYLQRGVYTVPVQPLGKKPWDNQRGEPRAAWERLRVTPADIEALFVDENNIGIILGVPSGGLVDTDLDCPEARRAAPLLLPKTGMIGGRESAIGSHYFFTADNPPDNAAEKFRDPLIGDRSANLLLELRSTGGQTVVAPSVYGPEPEKGHPVTERFVWKSHGEPARVSAEVLHTAVRSVAAAALLGRYWPRSGRHDAALALAGGLRRAGWLEEAAVKLVTAVCAAANDEEPGDRVSAVRSTFAAERDDKLTGWPTLITILGANGKAIVGAATEWLGIEPAPRVTIGGPRPQSTPRPYKPVPEWRPFPTQHLPAAVREFVATVARAMRCDSTYVALPALSVCAGMIGATRTIQLKRSWQEPVITWTAVVGESGTLKTPPYKRAIAPVIEMQSEHIKKYQEEATTYRQELRQYERDKKRAGAEDPGDPPTEPVCTRIYSRDTTVEALAGILTHNRDRLLIGRDELSGWLTSFNQYKAKGGSDLANWLELHGLGTLCVDRKTGETKLVFVKGVGASVCGGIQPGVLRGVLSAQHFSAGIPARLLFAWPPRIPKEWVEDDIDEAVEARYTTLVRALAKLQPQTDVEGEPYPQALAMTPEAKAEWVRFYRRFANRQTEVEGELAAAFSKLEGYAARLSLLHHVCESVDSGDDGTGLVGVESIRAGISLAEWFAYEAERVYQMLGEDREDSDTRALLERVRQLAKRFGGRLTSRQLQNSNSRKYHKTTDAEAALEALVARGLGKWETLPTTEKGGHPTRAFVPLPTSDTSDTTPDDGDSGDGGIGSPGSDTTPPRPTQPHPGGLPQAPPSDGKTSEYPAGGDTGAGVVSEVSEVGNAAGSPSGCAHEGEGGSVGRGGVVSEVGVPSLTRTAEGVAALADLLTTRPPKSPLGLDTETTGLDPLTDRVRLIQVAVGDEVVIIDVFALPEPVKNLKPLFEVLATQEVVGHNLQFDLRMLAPLGLVPWGLFDTMLASRLLYAGEREDGNMRIRHGLEDVVERELGRRLDKGEQRSDWSGPLTPEQLRYAAADVLSLVPLAESLKAKLAAANLTATADLEMRALRGVAWAQPIHVDRAAWKGIAERASAERARLANEMDELAPNPVSIPGMENRNWDSPEQVKEAFEQLGVPVASTNDDTLAGIDHPLAAKLREYRGLAKQCGTYGDSWLKQHLDSRNRVLPSWNQLGAESGRMSCSGPNLQQIPRAADYRRCFIARPGRLLVKADYSQIELRIAAKVANEQVMIEAYRDRRDLHTLTASRILGKPEGDVTKADRQLAKAVNFGLLYGMGWKSLRQYAKANYGVELTDKQAQAYRAAFFKTYPALQKWHTETEARVKKLFNKDPASTHEVRTLAGRRRVLPVAKRDAEGKPYPNKTDALNTPVQGTGADGLKAAIADLWDWREVVPSAVPVLFCHDEIVIEVAEEEASAAASWLKNRMVAAVEPLVAPVPVEVEVTIGRTWAGEDKPTNQTRRVA